MTEIELICVEPNGAAHPVVVTVGPAHRIADLIPPLCAQLGTSGPLYLGTTPLPEDLSPAGAGLTDGSMVGVAQPLLAPDNGLISGEVQELAVVGGLYGGPSRVLHPGAEIRIGRGSDADLLVRDPEISRDHARITVGMDGAVSLADSGSHNGIRWQGWRLTEPARLVPGDVAGLAETVLGLRPAVLSDAEVTTAPDGITRWFNRPPRVFVPGAREQPPVPVAPQRPAGVRLPWRGAWKEYAAEKREYERASAAFQARLAAACVTEERLARAADPDPSWVVAVACAPSARLWERRRGDPDFLRLRLGLHDRPRLRLESRQSPPESFEPSVVRDVPAAVELRRAGVLGMAGERASLLRATRAVLVQAAGRHAPGDLGLVVITDPDAGADWEWTTWLPHTRSLGPARLIATDCGQAEARLSELRAVVLERLTQQRAGLPAGREFLVVVDGVRRLRGLPWLAELLADGPAAGLYTLCLDDDETALPAECGSILTLTGRSGSRARLCGTDRLVIEDVLVDGLELGAALRMALALAPLETRDAPGESPLPQRVRFGDQVGPAISGAANVDGALIGQAWLAVGDGPGTTAVVGVGPAGPVSVDLCRDGPHCMVVGTSGAGKSELLRTLVMSLALGNPPDALTFVLVDHQGGGGLAACADLPHCAGLITDVDGQLAALPAELRHRERLLADADATDIDEYRKRTGERLPRLVIVVDEAASLVERVPEFLPGLVGIGAPGRRLGLHVVLATRRPGALLPASLRADLTLRICLRVTAESESADVLGVGAAAHIPPGLPGRAYLRSGDGRLTAFQAARVIGTVPPEVETVSVRPRRIAELGCLSQVDNPPDGAVDLSALVAAMRVAAPLAGNLVGRSGDCG